MRIWRHIDLRFWSAALAMIVIATAWGNTAAAEGPISFKEDIFPIFELRCLSCHQPGGSGYEASGLDLRTYEGLMKGTKFGPIVVPRDWFESNLLAVIERRTDPELWMPHNRKPVSKCEKMLIRFWVTQGAADN